MGKRNFIVFFIMSKTTVQRWQKITTDSDENTAMSGKECDEQNSICPNEWDACAQP